MTTDHHFEGFDESFDFPVAICACGARWERATEPKAREALNLHIAREALAAGRRSRAE